MAPETETQTETPPVPHPHRFGQRAADRFVGGLRKRGVVPPGDEDHAARVLSVWHAVANAAASVAFYELVEHREIEVRSWASRHAHDPRALLQAYPPLVAPWAKQHDQAFEEALAEVGYEATTEAAY